MGDDKKGEFAIDEFKALREEVKRCESESLSVTLYVFTAVVLAAGLAERSGFARELIPFLIQVVLLWAMNRYHALISLRMRLSTYIQVMLEPVLPGIRWESRNDLFESAYRKKHYSWNSGVNWWLHRLTHVFVLLSLISLYVSFTVVKQFPTSGFLFLVYLMGLVLFHLTAV